MPPQHSDDAPRLRRLRIQVFAATWLSYAGYYFCRKPFYKAKGTLTRRGGLGSSALGNIGTAYLGTYAVGQFASGGLGAWLGPRRLVLLGMALSIGCNAIAAAAPFNFAALLSLMALNGLAQSTGWPGNVGTMAHWFRRAERGTVMGFWCTCYQVGGVLAGVLAAYLLGGGEASHAFLGGAAVLTVVWIVFYALQRDRPEDVGLPPFEPAAAVAAPPGAGQRSARWWRFERPAAISILLLGATYFCIKFVRYALLSWATYLLELSFGAGASTAGYLTEIFDGAGALGAIFAGVVSDRLCGGRRSGVILALICGMTAACLLLWLVGPRSVAWYTICLGLVGFMLYGPDTLLSATSAIDVASPERAVVAAGIINGMGAVGSVLQEKVVGALYEGPGRLGIVFATLFGAAGLALLCGAALLWRSRRGQADV